MRWQSLSLMAFYDRVYRPAKHQGAAPNTIKRFEAAIRNLTRFAEWRVWQAAGAGAMYDRTQVNPKALRVSSLSDELLAGFIAWRLSEEVSPATVNADLRHVKALWRFARRKSPLLRSQLDEPLIDDLPEQERLPDTFSDDEFFLLMQQARSLTGTTGSQSGSGRSGRAPACLFWPALIGSVYDTAGRYTDVLSAPARRLDLAAAQAARPACDRLAASEWSSAKMPDRGDS